MCDNIAKSHSSDLTAAAQRDDPRKQTIDPAFASLIIVRWAHPRSGMGIAVLRGADMDIFGTLSAGQPPLNILTEGRSP